MREPASNRSKPCASQKKPHESHPFAAPCRPSRKKTDHDQRSAFNLRNLPDRAFYSHAAQGFSFLLSHQRSSCPPPSSNLVRTHPIERYQALHDSAAYLSRSATSQRTPNWSSEEVRTWENHPHHIAAASQPAGRIAKTVSGCISRG